MLELKKGEEKDDIFRDFYIILLLFFIPIKK